MPSRVAKVKKLDVVAEIKNGKQNVTITWEDDKIGYYTYSEGKCPLLVTAQYFYEYEDKVSARKNSYQKISKIEEWKPPEETNKEVDSGKPKTINQISPELRAELKTKIVIAVNHEVMEAFTKDKITEVRIKELNEDISGGLVSLIDEIQ